VDPALSPVIETKNIVEPLLVVIVGPTGSGKTALSLRLAERFSGEIVSCDSVAVYRDFEIGTAKPSREERSRIPHHLIDEAAPTETFTAGEYARRARAALKDIAFRGRLPIVVGGTGLYLRALIEGLFSGPQRSEDLRERLHVRAKQRGAEYLHRMLKRIDPQSAANIHGNDLPKVIRAIEICLSTREKMSELWKRGRDPLTGFHVMNIGLNPDRKQLYERINQRCRQMFEDELVEETRGLLNRYPELLSVPNSPLNSLGYRQAVQFIRGEVTLEAAISAAQQAHRNYAKRQLTWFRKVQPVSWFEGFGNENVIQARVAGMIAKNAVLQSKD
jgi:tRNA dimethylallyltransferase